MELETLNKLYLELSQFATAKTQKEIELEDRIHKYDIAIFALREIIYELAEQQAMPDDFWKKRLEETMDKLNSCPF